MSTVTVSPGVAILDRLIDHVSKLPLTSSASSASPDSSSPPPAAAAQSSYLPTSTVDVAWRPIIPIGHTAYSWVGEDDAPVSSAPSSSSSVSGAPTVPPTAPSASAAASAASAPPSGSAPPAAEQKARPAAKEKKPAAASRASGKAEEKKDEAQQQPDISRLDIRVGQVVKAWKHPEAEKLYVEEIDVGEERPRQVVSGLVDFIPLSDFQSARLCVICNLKPSALRGITSYGMVLAASNAERSVVELITPPASAAVGTRLRLSTLDVAHWAPDAVVDPKKKGGVWEKVKAGLRTDAQGRATYEGAVWMAGDGECTSQTLKDAVIS